MSGFCKNVIPRRIHKERSQPQLRIAKHGLLEKKKDYRLRAKDAHRKAARIKVLKEKAAFRNPDEFYYSMINSKTRDGVINQTVDKSQPNAIPLDHRPKDQRLLSETQDGRYVAHKLAVESSQVEKLKKGLHFIDEAKNTPRTHILFADDDDEADEIVAQQEQKQADVEEVQEVLPESIVKRQRKAYNFFSRRVERQEKLNTVLNDMSMEKKLLSKGRRVLVKPADKETGAPPIFRWLQQRSR